MGRSLVFSSFRDWQSCHYLVRSKRIVIANSSKENYRLLKQAETELIKQKINPVWKYITQINNSIKIYLKGIRTRSLCMNVTNHLPAAK